MNNIPNFVSQVQDVERLLENEWLSAQTGWRDCVAVSFSRSIFEPYMRNFYPYITGEGINGYGLERLLQQMDKHLHDMLPLTSE